VGEGQTEEQQFGRMGSNGSTVSTSSIHSSDGMSSELIDSPVGGSMQRGGPEQRRRKSDCYVGSGSGDGVVVGSRRKSDGYTPQPLSTPAIGTVGPSTPPLPLPLPLPEIQPPSWVADCDAVECKDCSAPFGFQLRRHHCRNCGQVFCHRCCRERLRLPHLRLTKAVRVCKECEAQVLALREHCPGLLGSA
jgi:hypothetical protein